MRIFVGNLAREATEEELRQQFEAYGRITSVEVVRDIFSRASKGFGFVEMPTRTEAEAAIRGLNATQFKGKPLNVNEARPRPERGGRGRR
jgi:RNA recognition motif-containing protein